MRSTLHDAPARSFDFAPGEELIYNTSTYFLLGLIFERASGQSYADFVKARLFDRVGAWTPSAPTSG